MFSVSDGSGPSLSPSLIFTRVPFSPGHFSRILSPFFLLPPLRLFMCGRPSTSISGWASVVRPSEDYFTTLRLAADQMPFSWCPIQRPVCRFAPPPDLCSWWYLAWVWVEGQRRRRPPRWSGVPRRVGRRRPG